MAEQLMVYEVGDRFATVSETGEVRVYAVGWDGRAYVAGYAPERPKSGGSR